MNFSPDHKNNEKAIRLVEYLIRLASLRTKLIRDIADNERVLWISHIPHQKGCFTQAWGRNEDYDSDIWIEIQNRREPELPNVPEICKDWIDAIVLRNKKDMPVLLPEISIQTKNCSWREGTDQPEFISRVEKIEVHPEVQRLWDRYIEERWLPWTEEHNDWESVHKVYSDLFAIHQEQLRLGEEYELVLGLGLLAWQTPSGQRVRRHLIVANALLEFEAHLGKFTIRPMPDGPSVRPELDMLDIGEQPARAEEMAKSILRNAGDDPWEKTCIEGVLKALVHSINPEGEYKDTLEEQGFKASSKPVVTYAPAVILRKRSVKGLTETLKRIKEKIEEGEVIPSEFGDLAEIRQVLDMGSASTHSNPSAEFDGEVFFPKPSNEEQRRIVDKIRAASGVLVQGPPGTGKSHTIANLICHLLATGQRILVTAKTPRALQVLEGLVPDELRPLCINLLGSGLEEKRSLESSVGGILRKHEEWNEKQATSQREEFEKKLRGLREEKAQIDRRLSDIKESETHAQSIADGKYRGTAARIAEAVNRDRILYEWFTDNVSLDKACPITESDLQNVLIALRQFTPQKRKELSLIWPDTQPSAEKFAELIEREKMAIDAEARSIKGADEQIAGHLSKVGDAIIQAMADSLSAFKSAHQKLSASPYLWMQGALRDVIAGNSFLWRELSRVTRDTIAFNETRVFVADDSNVDLPDGANIRTLLEDAGILKEHMANGGRLGWGPFRPKVVKERIYILKTVRVNGCICSNIEHFSILSDILRVRVECKKAWGFWKGRHEETYGPYALQIYSLKALCDALDEALLLESFIEESLKILRQCPHLDEPIWADESQIEKLIASCRLALASRAKHFAAEEIRKIEAPLAAVVTKSNVHPITSELIKAIRNRDVYAFAHALNKIQQLERERQNILKVDDYIKRLHRLAPRLTVDLEHTSNHPCWNTRIQQVQDAWRWAQARFWVEEYIRKEDATGLAKRARQIEDEIHDSIAKLSSLRAWSFCFSRLKESHRRQMEAWRQSMRRLGKGTGKHAPRHRREAQQHLNECREAVPAWVMPLHRVWDTVDPSPGLFEVIIVDEASQCGFEAIPLFYLGKKILIVGDDKQISPEVGFIDGNSVFQLMNQFLYDFEYKDSFHRDASLFDHGKLRYGNSRISLQEHFRCMPEIIRFSNILCYSDTPLIPLRQYGPDRLIPLQNIFVNGGYREGSNNRAVNRPEADAIVEKIVELSKDERYFGKTIGVIVLQGEAQAGLIEGQLLDRLGAEEMEKRRLVCGNSYNFQGDERDIIFLSMVAAPNERIGPLTKAGDERRFNVAASRARDQMYLFHSVTCNDLSVSCLRRKLLEFFENTKPQEIAGINQEVLERRGLQDNRSIVNPPQPFDSWFEVDVALEILRKGFVVNPQFEVAGKRIDMVVEGGQARLAVECDGDEFHGVEHYEQDMQRQRMLERCGWVFYRVRASEFYANKNKALEDLWRLLEERNICPFHSNFINRKKVSDNTEEKVVVPINENLSGQLISAEDIKLTDTQRIEVGDTIKYIFTDNPNEEYQVLISHGGSHPEFGTINVKTPVAQILLNAKVGDVLETKLPMGTKYLRVLEIQKGKLH